MYCWSGLKEGLLNGNEWKFRRRIVSVRFISVFSDVGRWIDLLVKHVLGNNFPFSRQWSGLQVPVCWTIHIFLPVCMDWGNNFKKPVYVIKGMCAWLKRGWGDLLVKLKCLSRKIHVYGSIYQNIVIVKNRS